MVHIHDVIPNMVSVIDGKTKTLFSSIPIGGSIVHVYVTDFNSNELRAIQSVISTGSISLQNSHYIYY
jgi:DNA-binding beta-propeller fold protein YncE